MSWSKIASKSIPEEFIPEKKKIELEKQVYKLLPKMFTEKFNNEIIDINIPSVFIEKHELALKIIYNDFIKPFCLKHKKRLITFEKFCSLAYKTTK